MSRAIVMFGFIAAFVVTPAVAQDRPGPAVEFSAGALLFADDSVVTEPFVGGAGRFYVSPRVSVGPEIAFISGDNHSHSMVTGNVTFDLLSPLPTGPRTVTPFFVVGGGWFQTREQFLNNETFTSTEGAFTAGGGVRAHVSRRLFVGAEARVGWELHLRLNAIAGLTFGR